MWQIPKLAWVAGQGFFSAGMGLGPHEPPPPHPQHMNPTSGKLLSVATSAVPVARYRMLPCLRKVELQTSSTLSESYTKLCCRSMLSSGWPIRCSSLRHCTCLRAPFLSCKECLDTHTRCNFTNFYGTNTCCILLHDHGFTLHVKS